MTNIFKTAKLHIFLQPFFLIIGFVWNSFLTKNLSVDDFGLFNLGITLFAILATFANFGMAGSLMRYIPLYEEQKKLNALKNIYYSSLLFPIVFGFVFYILVVLFQDNIQNSIIEDFSSIVYIFGLYIIVNAYLSSAMKIIITNGDFLYTKINELIFHKLFPLVVLFTINIFVKLDVWIVSTIYVLGLFTSSLILSKKVMLSYKQIDLKRFKFVLNKEYFRYSFYISLTGLVSMLYMWSDNLMIGYFLGNYDVGIYSAIFLIAIVLKNFWYMAFSPILLPVLSRYIAIKDTDNIKITFEILQKSLFLLTIPIFVVFLYFGSNIISLLFTTEYLAGLSSFYTLSFLYLITIFFGYSSYVISAYGDSKVLFKVTIVTLIFNIILNVVLIPQYGIIGAAISTGISEVIYAFLTYVIVYKRYNISINSKSIFGLMAGICLVFGLHIFENNFEYVVLALFVIFYSLYTYKNMKQLYGLYKGNS